MAREGDFVGIEVTANAFLHHMVRNIAGLLIAIGQGERPVEWAKEVLESRDRTRGHVTAPAEGLYFWSVEYPEVFGLPIPAQATDPLSSRLPCGRQVRRMSWFEKIKPSRIKTERRTRSVPEGLWIKCPACDAVLYRAELERNLYVCPKCQPPHAHRRSRAAGVVPRPEYRGRDRREHHARRSTQVSRQQAATKIVSPRPRKRRVRKTGSL